MNFDERFQPDCNARLRPLQGSHRTYSPAESHVNKVPVRDARQRLEALIPSCRTTPGLASSRSLGVCRRLSSPERSITVSEHARVVVKHGKPCRKVETCVDARSEDEPVDLGEGR